MAKHLRVIADELDRRNFGRFPLYLRAAARELSEIRWENGMLRRKLGLKARKFDDAKI